MAATVVVEDETVDVVLETGVEVEAGTVVEFAMLFAAVTFADAACGYEVPPRTSSMDSTSIMAVAIAALYFIQTIHPTFESIFNNVVQPRALHGKAT